MSEHLLDVPGGHIAYDLDGEGESTIVWVHGLPLDASSWRDQIAFFATHRNVSFDLRGYGRSSKLPDGPLDVTELYASDLEALLQALDLRDVTLVGFASGAHVAMRFAAGHPERVAKLVVINGSPRFERGPNWPYGFDDAGVARFTDLARDGGIAALTDAVLDPDVVFRDVEAEEAERLRRRFAASSERAGVRTLLGFFDGISHDDDRALLPQIAAETLIIASAIGQEVPSEVALYMRDRIPRAHLIELPGVDHFAFATRPRLINELIDQVLPATHANPVRKVVA